MVIKNKTNKNNETKHQARNAIPIKRNQKSKDSGGTKQNGQRNESRNERGKQREKRSTALETQPYKTNKENARSQKKRLK